SASVQVTVPPQQPHLQPPACRPPATTSNSSSLSSEMSLGADGRLACCSSLRLLRYSSSFQARIISSGVNSVMIGSPICSKSFLHKDTACDRNISQPVMAD